MCSKVYVSGSMGEMPSSCTALKREDTPAALGGVCTIWAWKGNLPSLVCSGGSGGLLEEGQRATGWGGDRKGRHLHPSLKELQQTMQKGWCNLYLPALSLRLSQPY